MKKWLVFPASVCWIIVIAGLADAADRQAATKPAQTGDLQIQFIYDGDVPPARPVAIARAPESRTVPDETLIVDSEMSGVQNVAVYALSHSDGTPLSAPAATPQDVTITINECQFSPRVAIARTGDTIVFDHQGDFSYLPRINWFRNRPHSNGGLTIPLKPTRREATMVAEPAPVPVDCHIHPWMRCWVIVSDNPFAAVSDRQGVVQIHSIPAGEITFRIFHEAFVSSFPVVIVDGESKSLNHHRVDLTIQPSICNRYQIQISTTSLK